MKLKLKFDLPGIKNWMLEHGEKLAFGVVGVVFVLFTYYALQREVLEPSKQPERLRDLATNVSQHLTSSRWDAQREGVQVIDYSERAASKPLDIASVALWTPFNPPVTDPKAKRDVPEVLGVEELRVASGYDLFQIKEAAGGKNEQKLATARKAQPWAVVTALVPVERQKQEFERAFAHAVGADSKRDFPQYYAPLLERCEFDESHPEKEDWKQVPFAKQYEDQWIQDGGEIVSKKYVDSDLTGRLGQLVNNGKWGESVSHPKVPLEGEESQPVGQPDTLEEPAPTGKNEEDAKKGSRFQSSKREEERRTQASSGNVAKAEPKPVEYRLLRVFDYSAEPGKTYRYRVIIGLKNPNFGRPQQYLKKPESAGIEDLTSQPSSVSPVVTIPDGHGVLAGQVEPGSRHTEPSAKLLVTAIDADEGLEAAIELDKVYRGTIANVTEQAVKVKDPQSNAVKSLTRDFHSNILLLDIYGGWDLPGKRRIPAITAPGELLIMDANGNMTVRNELDDQAQYERSIVRDQPVEPKSALDEKRKPSKSGK